MFTLLRLLMATLFTLGSDRSRHRIHPLRAVIQPEAGDSDGDSDHETSHLILSDPRLGRSPEKIAACEIIPSANKAILLNDTANDIVHCLSNVGIDLVVVQGRVKLTGVLVRLLEKEIKQDDHCGLVAEYFLNGDLAAKDRR